MTDFDKFLIDFRLLLFVSGWGLTLTTSGIAGLVNYLLSIVRWQGRRAIFPHWQDLSHKGCDGVKYNKMGGKTKTCLCIPLPFHIRSTQDYLILLYTAQHGVIIVPVFTMAALPFFFIREDALSHTSL